MKHVCRGGREIKLQWLTYVYWRRGSPPTHGFNTSNNIHKKHKKQSIILFYSPMTSATIQVYWGADWGTYFRSPPTWKRG